MKEECESVVRGLIDELHRQIPTHKVMTTLGVVYPQFWATNGDEVEENFHTYLAILKATFCVLHKMGENENIVHVVLSIQALDLETYFFKMTMLHNVKAVLQEENQFNLCTKLWHRISRSFIFNHKLSKFIKLISIVTIQVLGSIEDELTSNIVNFMKNRLWNKLSTHLDLCTKFYSKRLFAKQSFPYEQTIG
jgi:hypothetical protein